MPQAAWKPDVVTDWLMVVVCLAGVVVTPIVAPFRWVLNPDAPDFNPVILIPLVCGVAGLYFLGRAVLATLQARRSGESVLELEGEDEVGRLGQPLRGRLRTARALQPTGDYRVALQCVDVHRFRKRGETPHEEEFVVWEEVLVVPAAGVDSTRGIPFAFTMPKSIDKAAEPALLGSPMFKASVAVTLPGKRPRIHTRNSPPEARRWRIELSAPMAGPDFTAYYLVPMN